VEFLEKEFGISKDRIDKAFTVGQLYDSILAGIESIPESELFIGDSSLQVGPETCHFNDIVKVTDHASARKAIHTITEQGEGTTKGENMPADQVDCHYGLFVRIDEEYDQLLEDAKKSGIPFVPARPTISNPVPSFHLGQSPAGAQCIGDPYSNDVAALFDNIYSLMLRILQYVFQSGPLPNQQERELADIAIQIMTRVLKPVGEALTLLPAGPEFKHQTCGPAFGLYRHVSFPKDAGQVVTLVKEGLSQIIETGKGLAQQHQAPVPLKEAVQKLENILLTFQQAVLQP
jgi:hypothetical protein